MSTYNPLIPSNSDSPGIFPAQSRQNFTRLQQLIGADHQFNDTAAANDGYHNLIHMSIQAPTGALAATGRLYVKIVSGLVQLFYMDDAGTEYQITPQSIVSPIRVTGTATINGMSFNDIFPTPAYDYTGIFTVYVNNTTSFFTDSVIRSGANAQRVRIATNNLSVISGAYVSTTYRVTNSDLAPYNVVWSLIINRTT